MHTYGTAGIARPEYPKGALLDGEVPDIEVPRLFPSKGIRSVPRMDGEVPDIRSSASVPPRTFGDGPSPDPHHAPLKLRVSHAACYFPPPPRRCSASGSPSDVGDVRPPSASRPQGWIGVRVPEDVRNPSHRRMTPSLP